MRHSYKLFKKGEGNSNKFLLSISSLKRAHILILISILIFSACNLDEVFEKEQYKNVFALISEKDNVSRKFHSLGKESIGIVAASLGGTNPTEKDIVINLIEDPSYIDIYNKINFDVDKNKYIRPLPKDKYDIESLQFTIPAGKISGQLPIRIRPDGLSPDSSYFIPLRIESHTAYEANQEKNYVLYRVRIKNYWAVGDGSTSYNMNALLSEVGQTYELQMPGTKIMHPISKNKVRIMAGNEKYESNINVFNEYAMILTIDESSKKVTISPYKNVQVTQIDGDSFYTNTFLIDDDGFKTFKTFRLKYQYKSGLKNYIIKEELRLQYNKDEEDADAEKDS